MAKKKSASKKSQPPSFESSLESLHGVVEQLEEGQLSLSDSLEQYEQGVKHLKNCHASLKDAQRRIELLVRVDEDGNLVTQDFDDSATEDVGTRQKRSSGGRTKKAPKNTRPPEEQELVDELDEEMGAEASDEDPSSLF